MTTPPTPMPTLIAVPGGTIVLRDARADSSRSVELQPFELGRTAMTAAEYDTVGGDAAGRDAAGASTRAPSTVPRHPVTWFDAVRWCNAASAASGLAPAYAIDGRAVEWNVRADGFRLPTEAEWEWACRGGASGVGDPGAGSLADIAWTAADAVAGPQPVAGKQANAFGLFDMLGNVWEWCWDYADTARYGDYRSLRGGGWADRAWSVRASVRRGSAPDALLEDVGFRVARGAVGGAGDDAEDEHAAAVHAQGWSAEADRKRADVRGPRPVGWTPLRFPPAHTTSSSTS